MTSRPALPTPLPTPTSRRGPRLLLPRLLLPRLLLPSLLLTGLAAGCAPGNPQPGGEGPVTGAGGVTGSGRVKAYGEVDLLRLGSDKPPPPPYRDVDRYFQSEGLR